MARLWWATRLSLWLAWQLLILIRSLSPWFPIVGIDKNFAVEWEKVHEVCFKLVLFANRYIYTCGTCKLLATVHLYDPVGGKIHCIQVSFIVSNRSLNSQWNSDAMAVKQTCNPMFSEPETKPVKIVSVGVSLVRHFPLVSFHNFCFHSRLRSFVCNPCHFHLGGRASLFPNTGGS